MTEGLRSPAVATAAAVVLALEGAALVVFAIIELFGLGAGQATSPATAIALIVLTLIGAAALFAFAVGTRRGRTWARSGGVVLQILALALALASLTAPPVVWMFVFGVGVPALVGLVLLVATSRREGRPESDPRAETDS